MGTVWGWRAEGGCARCGGVWEAEWGGEYVSGEAKAKHVHSSVTAQTAPQAEALCSHTLELEAHELVPSSSLQ